MTEVALAVGFSNSAEKILLMQNPLNIRASDVIDTYVYRVGIASAGPNYSYASAVGLFNSAINFALLIIANRLSRRFSDSSLY